MEASSFPGTLLPPSVVARIPAEKSLLSSAHSAPSGWVNTIADSRLETADCFRRRAPEEMHVALLPQTPLQPWILDWVPVGRPLGFIPLLFVRHEWRLLNRLSSLSQIPPSFPD